MYVTMCLQLSHSTTKGSLKVYNNQCNDKHVQKRERDIDRERERERERENDK